MKTNVKLTAAAAAAAGLFTSAMYACSSETGSSQLNEDGGNAATGGKGGATTGTGGGTTTGKGGEGGGITFTNTGGNGQGGDGGDDMCPDVVVEADVTYKPADIIFVIDNSGSMSGEITQVESNINGNFANIIGASKVDYRVVMLTSHGSSSLELCVTPPLGTGNCSGPPGENPGKFYHYSYNVQSHDALCKILNSFYGTAKDEFNQYPMGWSSVLRTEAVKVFVMITDDGIVCSYNGKTYNDQDQDMPGKLVAVDWDKALLQLSPAHFGTQAARNYIFYSIIGMKPKNPANLAEPWTPFDPVTTEKCGSGSVAPGTGYQYLSKGTGGLRFQICPDAQNNQDFSPVFKDIAAGVVAGAAVPCEFDLPKPEPGQKIDYEKILLLYTPGDQSGTKTFVQVPSEAACDVATDKFYIKDNKIKLCPKACDAVTNDDMGKVQVKIPCEAIRT